MAPGADPGQIQLTWRGGPASLAEDGTLHVDTPLGTIQETAPVAWQDRSGQRVPVAARWTASDVGADEQAWGFVLGSYDPSLPLTIDPTVLYATYIGGSDSDQATAMAIDGSGAVYLTGTTNSSETTFPNGGGFGSVGVVGIDQSFNGNQDVFVAKLAPNGQTLAYATYIGGTGQDGGTGIAVDSSGAAYVTGFTTSGQTTFPNGTGFAGTSVAGLRSNLQRRQRYLRCLRAEAGAERQQPCLRNLSGRRRD